MTITHSAHARRFTAGALDVGLVAALVGRDTIGAQLHHAVRKRAEKVSVVGDFNGWDPSANRFGKRSNKTFSTAITLDSGCRHSFRYITEDGRWVNDDDADAFETTPFGSLNCVLET